MALPFSKKFSGSVQEIIATSEAVSLSEFFMIDVTLGADASNVSSHGAVIITIINKTQNNRHTVKFTGDLKEEIGDRRKIVALGISAGVEETLEVVDNTFQGQMKTGDEYAIEMEFSGLLKSNLTLYAENDMAEGMRLLVGPGSGKASLKIN